MCQVFLSLCVYDIVIMVCALYPVYIYFNFAGLVKLFEELHLPRTWDTELAGTLANPHLASYTYVLENMVLEEMITLIVFNGFPLAEEDSGKKCFQLFAPCMLIFSFL
jgi:hypothetical protein